MRVHDAPLPGIISSPLAPRGLIVVPSVVGASGYCPLRERFLSVMHERRFATLLLDLLTFDEQQVDAVTRTLRYKSALLGERLRSAMRRVADLEMVRLLPFGLLAFDLALAPAVVATLDDRRLRALVAHAGRLDVTLMRSSLKRLKTPIRLMVGQGDTLSEDHARVILTSLRDSPDKALDVIQGLDHAAELAARWFERHLLGSRARSAPPLASARS